MALRKLPELGDEVRIEHLGSTVQGVVRALEPDRRRLEVVTEDGRAVIFALNPATATFTLDGRQSGARLRF
jgi:hypothetical protein